MLLYALLILQLFLLPSQQQGQCPGNQIQSKCFQYPCNPQWFNWFGGCYSEMKIRETKGQHITNTLDTIYRTQANGNKYQLNYIDFIMGQTEKMQRRTYTYLFVNKTDKPLVKDAIKNLEGLVINMGMNQKEVVKQIQNTIIDHETFYLLKDSLNQVQAFYKSIFYNLDDTYELSKQTNQQQGAFTPQEQIHANLLVIENDFDALMKILFEKSNQIEDYAYYTYQLFINTAILHINIKGLVALSTDDIQLQKQTANHSLYIYNQYKSKFNTYIQNAIDYRLSFISDVQCRQGKEIICPYTRCLKTIYQWKDEMTNIEVEEGNSIITDENSIYNNCYLYGEETSGGHMDQERMQYKEEIRQSIKEILNIFVTQFQKIGNTIIQPK